MIVSDIIGLGMNKSSYQRSVDMNAEKIIEHMEYKEGRLFNEKEKKLAKLGFYHGVTFCLQDIRKENQ